MKHRNRRKSKRFPLGYPFIRTSPAIEGFCVLSDLSVSGAQVLSAHPPPVGSRIRIWFDQGDMSGQRATGKVVRHNRRGERGFGVQFIQPNMSMLLSAVGKSAN